MTEFNHPSQSAEPAPQGAPVYSQSPYPASEPLAALPYYAQQGPYRGRPGILSAIGVISIVIACFSTIGSLISGCQSAGAYMMSNMSTNLTTSTTTVTANG